MTEQTHTVWQFYSVRKSAQSKEVKIAYDWTFTGNIIHLIIMLPSDDERQEQEEEAGLNI